MTANDLKKYLCSRENLGEKMEQIYQEARNLKEDIEFFSIYAKRNKVSEFQLDIMPSKGMCKQFLHDIFKNNYSFNLQDLASMLIEYEVLKDLMQSLSIKDTCSKEDEEKILDIYIYFQNKYDIDILDYTNDFIGCSHGCLNAEKIISEVINSQILEEESQIQTMTM